MANDDLPQKFQGLKIKENQDINILLLGETGVGKSTFINAIANYLHFKSFKRAEKADDLLVLIPSVITVTNKNYEQVSVDIGSADTNEFLEVGAAATQDVKTYVFPIGEGKTRLRLIDSPGMADPRGIDQDDINCENILAYLSQLKELHAICFLMKPTITRKTVLFDYCVQQILSRLEKSASKNIIFIFTNTRGTDYSPSESLPILKVLLEQIKAKPPHVNIPLGENVFPLDNEAFRFLAASKKGVPFNESVRESFITSWLNSSKECWRLISYIIGDASNDGLTPHQLVNTISINEARRIIVHLSKPLADISQLIHDNIRILERHQSSLQASNQDLDELKKKLYIPVIALEVTELQQPTTVCTSSKCSDLVKVEGVSKWHYRQRCHDPCYLTNVSKEIVGDTNLTSCAAMSQRVCMKCTCDYSVHMHVYYMTKTVSSKTEDCNVKSNISRKEEALRESQRLILQIKARKAELEEERDIIVKSTAQFAHFLQHNAISPFNDSYKAYIEYLISREKSLGRTGDPEVTYHLEQLLQRYEEMKAAFDNSLNLHKATGLNSIITSTVTPQSVMNTINALYKLKHNGKKIHQLLKSQKACRTSEYNNMCEYIHPKVSDKPKTDKTKSGSKTDDEKKKCKPKNDNKKDGKQTNDEKKHTGPPKKRNPQQKKPNQNLPPPPKYQWSEPPPPYKREPSRQSNTNANENPKEEISVKIEIKSDNSKKHSGNANQGYNRNYSDPQRQGTNYNGPPGQYHGPPQHQYHGPPQNTYHGPPLNQYGAPGPYHGPPQYPGPPPAQYYGHPQEQYHGAPSHYGGPPPQYYGPPQGFGPPAGQHYAPYQGPPQQRQNYRPGNRGAYNKNKGGDAKRPKSKPRPSKDRKSGNEKSKSDSDSSDYEIV